MSRSETNIPRWICFVRRCTKILRTCSEAVPFDVLAEEIMRLNHKVEVWRAVLGISVSELFSDISHVFDAVLHLL
jgi:hypothetical protein